MPLPVSRKIEKLTRGCFLIIFLTRKRKWRTTAFDHCLLVWPQLLDTRRLVQTSHGEPSLTVSLSGQIKQAYNSFLKKGTGRAWKVEVQNNAIPTNDWTNIILATDNRQKTPQRRNEATRRQVQKPTKTKHNVSEDMSWVSKTNL